MQLVAGASLAARHLSGVACVVGESQGVVVVEVGEGAVRLSWGTIVDTGPSRTPQLLRSHFATMVADSSVENAFAFAYSIDSGSSGSTVAAVS